MNNTNAQRQARWRQRQKTRIAELQARIEELENALKKAQNATIGQRFATGRIRGTAASPPPRPPVDPDSEVGRLKATIKTLRGKLKDLTRWHEDVMLRNGKLPLSTFRAIAKCLHPDREPTAEERETACRLLNDWRQSSR